MENNGKKTVSYTVFLYRQEVSRTKKNYKRLNQTKISLTDDLTSIGEDNLMECSMEDVKALKRALRYKQKLKQNLHRIRKMEKNGVKNAKSLPSNMSSSTHSKDNKTKLQKDIDGKSSSKQNDPSSSSSSSAASSSKHYKLQKEREAAQKLKNDVSKTVVDFLNPYYKRKIATKELFKVLAKRITNRVIDGKLALSDCKSYIQTNFHELEMISKDSDIDKYFPIS